MASVDRRLLEWAVAASLLVASVVAVESYALQTPTYEASAKILVIRKEQSNTRLIQPIPNVVSGRQDVALAVAAAVPTVPVARAACRKLNLPTGSARKVLENMSVESDPGTMFITITYTDSEAKRAQLVANAIGQVASQKIFEMHLGNNRITAPLWQPATLPETPVSPKPLRNGLIALVATLALSAVLAAVRHRLAR